MYSKAIALTGKQTIRVLKLCSLRKLFLCKCFIWISKKRDSRDTNVYKICFLGFSAILFSKFYLVFFRKWNSKHLNSGVMTGEFEVKSLLILSKRKRKEKQSLSHFHSEYCCYSKDIIVKLVNFKNI